MGGEIIVFMLAMGLLWGSYGVMRSWGRQSRDEDHPMSGGDPCPDCEGTGGRVGYPCPGCHGFGTMEAWLRFNHDPFGHHDYPPARW